MDKYSQCEISANIAFRSLITENGLNAVQATHILNGMLVEWQREALFQTLINNSETPNKESVESETDN